MPVPIQGGLYCRRKELPCEQRIDEVIECRLINHESLQGKVINLPRCTQCSREHRPVFIIWKSCLLARSVSKTGMLSVRMSFVGFGLVSGDWKRFWKIADSCDRSCEFTVLNIMVIRLILHDSCILWRLKWRGRLYDELFFCCSYIENVAQSDFFRL